jgi:hypothetical protein
VVLVYLHGNIEDIRKAVENISEDMTQGMTKVSHTHLTTPQNTRPFFPTAGVAGVFIDLHTHIPTGRIHSNDCLVAMQ